MKKKETESLEVAYLKALKQVDSQSMALDFDKREIRRRRQSLEDREVIVRKRQRRMEKMKERAAACDMSKIHEKERQIAILKLQLDSTIKKLNEFDGKSIYGLESSRSQVGALRTKERQLRSKMADLEARQSRARRVLSDPIDDTRMDEVMIDCLEQDIELAESQFHYRSDVHEVEDFERSCRNIQALEESNRSRKMELLRRQAEVAAAKQARENNPPESPRRLLSPRSRMALEVGDIVNRKSINSSLDRMFQSFIDRQNKINCDEKETDDLERGYKETRRETEEAWNAKMGTVKELTDTIRNNEQLKIDIAELTESLENEKHELNVLAGEREKIERRISNILRDRDYNSQKSIEHRKLVESLARRQQKIEEQDKKLATRRENLERNTDTIDKLEEEVNSQGQKVDVLDQQAKTLETQSDKRIAEIQQSTAEFEALRLTVPMPDSENAVFDKGFLESLGQQTV